MNKSTSKTKRHRSAHTRDRAMVVLLQVAHAIERRLEHAMDEVGLSCPKLDVLTQLVQADEPLPLSELARRQICVRSNITQLVDRLETEGLVSREEDPKDRRGVRAAITPLGRERQTAGARRFEEVQGAMAKLLSGIDCGALERAQASLQE